MVKRKPTSQKHTKSGTFRILSGFAGFLLGAALIIQYQGNNNCIWKVSYGLNIPVAFILAYTPKYIDSLLWLSWSITVSSLHTFLLLVFSIQILRGITAQSENNFFPDEGNNTSNFDDIFNSKFNIFNYEDGRECIGIFVILLWIKLTNLSRAPRLHKKAFAEHRNLFVYCLVLSVSLISLVFICTYQCQKEFCLAVVGL